MIHPAKIAICGPGQCGKAFVSAKLAQLTGLRYTYSTSYGVAKVVFEQLSHRYATVEECYADRRNHRKVWADIIEEYNNPTGIKLYEEMLEETDILDGIRRRFELEKCVVSGLLDLTIWVHNPLVAEDPTIDFGPETCDLTLDNSGSLLELERKIARFANLFN